jgi:hypothetical protein
MKQSELIVNNDILRSTMAGSICGGIFLSIEDRSFPEPDWSDFVIVILKWWCDALLELLTGTCGPVKVRFMEGPFLVELEARMGGMWQMNLVDNGGSLPERQSFDIDPETLLRSVIEAVERTLCVCDRQGLRSREVDELTTVFQNLQIASRNTEN